MDRNFDVSLNCKGGATVALRKESVDRNNRRPGTVNNAKIVALRKESVDRNILGVSIVSKQPVALRKESVDRNMGCPRAHLARGWSLSARRAWIEIAVMEPLPPFPAGSLSARRAWIEILLNTQNRHLTKSLSARRAWIEIETLSSVVSCPLSLSARRAWIEICGPCG